MKQLQTVETRKKALGTRNKSMALRKCNRIPAMSKALRKKCIECVCGSAHEVRMCPLSACPVWPFRFGRNPRADDLMVPEFDHNGNHTGYREYEGWDSNHPWGSGESE